MTFFSHKHSTRQLTSLRGFTLFELMLVIGLFAFLSVFVFASLSHFRAQSALESGREQVLTAMNTARANTLAAKNATAYGIYLDDEDERVVLFPGESYTPGDPGNRVYALHDLLEIQHIALSGGDQIVVFERLTGATENAGTFVLQLKGGGLKKVRFEVQKTGNIVQI